MRRFLMCFAQCIITFGFLLTIALPVSPAYADEDISASFTDSNFKQAVWGWLGNTGVPGSFTKQDLINRMAFKGYQLDITGRSISSLDGLENFEGTGLQSLICVNNLLVSLPELPDSLQTLYCYDNQLVSLPDLPNGLQTLYCYRNQLSSLPELPENLQNLSCFNNELNTLPELPNSLRSLRCDNNQLNSLHDLPDGLQYLFCNSNQLDTLPELPNSLLSLQCDSNQLDTLPELPDGLQLLQCSSNHLNSLPELPNSLLTLECLSNQLSSLPDLPENLQNLACPGNRLSSLPELPKYLQGLNCSYNELNTLPELPTLRFLACSNNRLISLPDLPHSLQYLFCSRNYLNVFAGPIYDNIYNCPADYRISTPQYRYKYTGTEIQMHISENRQLAGNVLKKQESNDGSTWNDIDDGDITKFSFSSSDETVATVSPGGLITAVGVGECTIYAIYGGIASEYTKTAVPVVVKRVKGIAFDQSLYKIKDGESFSFKLIATHLDGTTREITDQAEYWSLINRVASLDNSGIISGINPGIAIIHARYKNFSSNAYVIVTPVPEVKLLVTPMNMSLQVGDSHDIIAVTFPKADVIYASSDETVATVDDDGVVTAVAEGSATISVKAERAGYKPGSASVEVNVISAPACTITGIAFDSKLYSLNKGESINPVILANCSDGSTIEVISEESIRSANSNIVAVDDSGKVTGVRSGSTLIYARYGNYHAQAYVRVN